MLLTGMVFMFTIFANHKKKQLLMVIIILTYSVLAYLVPRLLAGFNGEVRLFNPAKTNALLEIHV